MSLASRSFSLPPRRFDPLRRPTQIAWIVVMAAGVATLAVLLLSPISPSPQPPSLNDFDVFSAAPVPGQVERQAERDRQRERDRMIREQIEERGIQDRRVIAAMRDVPRHLFVPEGLRQMAYEDGPLPIGDGQTISQPYIVALMTELLRPAPGAVVLDIGTGSGYQAAILSKLVKQVYTIEIRPELAESAKERLARLGYANVEVRTGDGYKGWPEHAPFDGILVAAAPPEVPSALVAQLAPGGRLVIPVGSTPDRQELLVIEKSASGQITERRVIPVRFVPMIPGN